MHNVEAIRKMIDLLEEGGKMTHEAQKAMANRLKERRKALNYTQEQFAELVGISANSYTRIENAFQRPSLNTLINIVQRLELSLDYAVFGTEERKPKELLNTDILNLLLEYADEDELLHVGELLVKIAKLKGHD